MNEAQPENLEQLIRVCGEDWIIDSFSPKDKALDYLRKALEAANKEAIRRGLSARFSEKSLVATYRGHAAQVEAFLQALGATQDPVMLVMVWRILQGMTISSVSMDYKNLESFKLRVVLASPYEDPSTEEYISTDINDAWLLRHFGIMTMGVKPVFDGFYATKPG
jgi:hypothetical protein